MARLIHGFTCELQHFNEGELSLPAHIQFMIGNYRFYKILEKDCYFLDRDGKILVCGNLETVNIILEGDFQLQLTTKPTSPETASEFIQISLGGFVQGSVVCF